MVSVDNMQKKDELLKITIKTFYGLEEVLNDELIELGFKNNKILNRAVQTEGSMKDVYYLNLHLRCAISVLLEVASFQIKHEDDLYTRCAEIDWTELFTLDKNFAVKGAVFSDFFTHSQYPFLVLKDAIADVFRGRYGERPDVNVQKPQILFDLYINKDKCVVSLNTSGAPLFKRGYRDSVGEAPLNEVVAAGMLRLSGWDKKSPLIDPFCGSGTILIEAALMATGIPALIERQHFAFKNFINYNPEVWQQIVDDVDYKIKELPCEIIGSDNNDEMITKARRNMRALSIGRFIKVQHSSFEEVEKIGETGTIITNPPYGERMGDDVEELYGGIGTWLKSKMSGYNAWILSSNQQAFNHVGLRPERKIKIFNGDLECSFRKYSMYQGSKKASKQNVDDKA